MTDLLQAAFEAGKAEQAQYNAMLEALAKEQAKNTQLQNELDKAYDRLDRICSIADGSEGDE